MKPIIGQKGVKYGLITRKDVKPQQKEPAGRLAAFGADSDSDEDNIGAQVARQAARKVADTKVQDMYAAALAEDPNAFEYDSLYDSMQEQKAAPKQQEKLARQPKYIASLLEQAEVRKRESNITYERVLLKERQKEDHMYDSSEKFVTAAYKRKLEEDRKWQESQRLKELEDEANDVTKLGHMNNFFTNLTRNVAMGGAGGGASAAAAAGAGPGSRTAQPPAGNGSAGSPPGGADGADPQQQQQQQQYDSAAAADEQQAQQRRQETEPLPLPDSEQEEQRQRASAGDAEQPGGRHAEQQPSGSQRGADAAAAASASKTQQQQPQEQQQEQPQPAVVGGKRKNDDSAVAAARERYLARKRQQQGQA